MHHLEDFPVKIINKIYLVCTKLINQNIKKLKFKKTQFILGKNKFSIY